MSPNSNNAVSVLVPEEDLCLIRASLRADDGIRLLPAASLAEALKGPELVFLYDADSPDPWPEALRRILEVRPAARVVLLSRLADSGMWIEAVHSGAYDLLPKPSRPSEMRAVRAAVLGALSARSYCAVG